ncbi:MAG: SprB repeat-containing protein [Cytophagales bacterium]|nr:SprB repeat-containing protein [Cytophagales bacterium]
MKAKSFHRLTGVVVFAWLLIIAGCSSNDEPKPIDCNATDLAITLSTKTDPVDCGVSNGSITVSATGGEAPYQFKLSTGSYGSGTTFNNLGAGSFTFMVKDANGCERTLAGIVLSAPSSPVAGASTISSHTNCLTPNGSITIHVTGGTPPYKYKIGSGAFGSSNNFSELKAGSYAITVQDDADCSITINDVVASNTNVSYVADIKPILQTSCIKSGCHNGDNGADRNWSVFANVRASAQAIKTRTGNKSMPADIAPTGLPQNQIDLIACWVDSGAQDN